MFLILFIINIVVAVLSYGIFSSASISPSEYWIAGFVSYLVPFALLINAAFVVFWLFFGKLKAILSALILISGAGFVKSTIAYSSTKEHAIKSEGDFDVMSYNVRVFNAYASWKNKKEHSGARIAEWLSREANPDIVCFQEFYHNKREDYLNMIKNLKSVGYPYYYFKEVLIDKGGGHFGMATFSKFPIADKGNITFKEGSNNMAIFIDVKISGEIVRVYNIHLESMSIDEKKAMNLDNVEKIGLFQKLKAGFKNRAGQVEKVLKSCKSSKNKVIICGDWNDLPYGYSYKIMQKYYDNAFEEAGRGLGFTFNGNMSFLRIDNQFFNKTIKIKKFDTYDKMKVSDHYPIMARYNLD